jgi:hypothetical protein
MFAGALGVASLAGTAQADTQDTEALRQQIADLQKQVDAMQTTQAATTAGLDQAALDRAVDGVLADAERRSELLSMQGFTAGYDKGFKIQSEDGAFLLKPTIQFQFRNVTTFGFDGEGADDVDFDDVENGFELRRVKFGASGNMFTEKLEYKFVWATSRNSGDVGLEDAYVLYEFADNLAFRAGQWKDNVYFIESTSSSRQMAVDRSGVNEVLGGGLSDRVQGVSLIFDYDTVRGEVAYHDGANSDNTGAFADDPDFGVSGRLEYKAFGSWGDYKDFSTVVRNPDEDLLVIGGGVNWTQDGQTNVFLHTVDALYKSSSAPLSVFGAYYGTYADFEDDDGYNAGLEVQVAYGIGDKTELFGRVGAIFLDVEDIDDLNQEDDFEDDFFEITIGGNYYFEGHAAKVTIDATYLPNGFPDTNSGIGYGGNDEDQFIIRGQFQLLI